MIRAISSTARWLLVLLQLMAPWVHAHTGTETGGILHVPGLEYMLRSGDSATAGPLIAAEGIDVIVGVQAGIGQQNPFPADPPDAVCPLLFHGGATDPGPVTRLVAWARPPPIQLRLAFLSGAPPRASPV